MGHKYASERKLPRRDEQRHAAPEATNRRRKSTRRWCRGKVGIEHVTEIRVGRRYTRPCSRPGWMPEWWLCRHQEVCVECGRIMKAALDAACPDYVPRSAS